MGRRRIAFGLSRRCGARGHAPGAVPLADLEQDRHGYQCGTREPHEAGLATRHDDESGKQRTAGLAEIAADLEQRLGKPITAACRHARHTRGFGMEH